MNVLQRMALAPLVVLLGGCGGGDSSSADMGVDGGEPDEGGGEQPVFADLSAAVQVDRVGKPLVSLVAIPSVECGVAGESCRTTYNRAESPADDAASFLVIAAGQLSGPDAAPSTLSLWQGDLLTDLEAAAVLADLWGDGTGAVLYGDMLVIDTSMPTEYSVVTGGCAPTDDVVDTTLDALTLGSAAVGNAAGVASDSIDANDRAFASAFPYFVEPFP